MFSCFESSPLCLALLAGIITIAGLALYSAWMGVRTMVIGAMEKGDRIATDDDIEHF